MTGRKHTMDEKRLENLETKVAFQEKAIKDLNDVLFAQQKEIDRLTSICEDLIKAGIGGYSQDQANAPPHY